MYLNEESLTLFSLLFLNTSIVFYFLTLKPKNLQIWLLIFAFFWLGIFYFVTMGTTSSTSLTYSKFILRKLELLPAIFSASFLVKFFLFFPKASQEKKKERSLILGFLLCINILAICITIFSIFNKLDFHSKTFLFQLLLVIILVVLLLFIIIKRSIEFKVNEEFRQYRSIRSFLNPFYLIFLTLIIEVLFVLKIIPERYEILAISLGLLGFHFLFALSFINHTDQKTSFMVKIIGISLVTLLFIWGNLGHFLVPFLKKEYKNSEILKPNTSLRFRPNFNQSYDISREMFSFDLDFGDEVFFGMEEVFKKESLPFSFSYYGTDERNILIKRTPRLSFGNNLEYDSFEGGIFLPTIYALGSIGNIFTKDNKVFLKKDNEKVTITWIDLEYKQGLIPTKEKITIQLSLNKDNSFIISYKDFPNYQYFPLNYWGSSLDFIGITPGNESKVEEINFEKDLPFRGRDKTGIGQSYYLTAKSHIHNIIFPLTLMLLGIGIFIVFVFPIFFQINLIRPLEKLVNGVKQVNDGELDIQVEVKFNDEVGFLTHSFNTMLHSVRESVNLKQFFIEEMTQLNEAYHKFIPEEFLSFLQKKSILEIKLGDFREMTMTVLFSDIRAYTNLSETMTPEENFKFLNSYLERVGPIIRKYNGFIDKYIGDAIMALFPKKVDDAISCAIEMQKAIEEYNQDRSKWNKDPVYVGIGIHIGDVVIGTIGENKRMEGTVVSDAVNISSRLENLTKFYSSQILISMESLLEIEDQSTFKFRILDKVKVKGKEKFISVVEILDGYEEGKLRKLLDTKIYFEQGIAFYTERHFAEAIKSFQKVIHKVPDDEASKIYIKRAEFYLKNGVPIDWNGIEVFDQKFSD